MYADGREIELTVGKTVFDYADSLKLRVPTSCGRTGECHECIIEIKQGHSSLSKPSASESFLGDNYRLACQAYVSDSDSDVEFATLRRQPRILTKRAPRTVQLAPRATTKNDKVYIDDAPVANYTGAILGLAGDIGTTTVGLNLVDLESGSILHTSSFENPQRFGGSDVMNRISYDSGVFRGELQQTMLSAINFEIGNMVKLLGFHRRQIFDAVFVGNTTMRDILFGIDVQPIGEKPYKSLIQIEHEGRRRKTTAIDTSALSLGLRVFPKARVYSGPLIGCHIGSDIAADLLTIGIDNTQDPVMLVDIGTNTEVVIGNKDKMVAASCPAGPAFEGGQITYGMPGYEGAIESVTIQKDGIVASTIGEKAAQGICGSGLIDLLAELRRTDYMTELGVLHDNNERFVFNDNDMSLNRADISNLAQAKSANYAGQFIALRHSQQSVDDISKLFLAGGFANYINTKNARNIGFIANFPTKDIKKVGNASLEGATIMIKSTDKRRQIENIVANIEHIELETTPDFFEIFVEGCMFKPMPKEIAKL